MGARGKPPRPTALKLLHGERSSRVNREEPTPDTSRPDLPDDASDEVREVWEYALRQLVIMGIESSADRDALRCFCEAVVVHRKSSALLARSPLLIQGHRGVMIRNPLLAVQRDASAVIRAFAHEFGFTPSARSEIRTGATKTHDQGAERFLTG